MSLNRRDLLLGQRLSGWRPALPGTHEQGIGFVDPAIGPQVQPLFRGCSGGMEPSPSGRTCALDGSALGVRGTQVAGCGVCPHGPGCGEPQSALRGQSGQ